MSRSGYSDECENVGLWRGNIRRATYGKRGQRFFKELVAALDAMPVKALVSGDLQTPDGEVCALGALGRHKGVAIGEIDTYDHERLGGEFGVWQGLAQEVMYENDEGGRYRQDETGKWVRETPAQRWERIRKWAAEQIKDGP